MLTLTNRNCSDGSSETEQYTVLAVNAFESNRKRMSVLVRDESSGQMIVLVKGADSSVLPLCKVSFSANK
jgi:magnesium-transporting ATPase (P-type)